MFCENCGAPLKEGAKFCENCGTKVRKMEAPSAAEAAAGAALGAGAAAGIPETEAPKPESAAPEAGKPSWEEIPRPEPEAPGEGKTGWYETPKPEPEKPGEGKTGWYETPKPEPEKPSWEAEPKPGSGYGTGAGSAAGAGAAGGRGFINGMFGFRSNNTLHKIVAIVFYAFVLVSLVGAITSGSIAGIISDLFWLSPIIVLHEDYRDKIPLFNKRQMTWSFLGFVILEIITSILATVLGGLHL